MSRPEDFLPYELGYLTPEIEMIAEQELHETDETRERCLDEFRALLKSEENLYVRTDDHFLLGYLRGKKYNVKKAFESFRKFYLMKAKYKNAYDPEQSETLHQVLQQNWIGFLPHRDKNGRVIFVWRAGLWDPDIVSRDLLIAAFSCCLFHSLRDPVTQVLGYTVILDFGGCGRKFLMQCTPGNIMLLIDGTQRCFPGRFKELHVIGVPKLVSLVYAIAYPFLTTKLRERMIWHGPDTKTLYDSISPCILPSEFGGERGPFDTKSWRELIFTDSDWWREQMAYGYK